MKRREYIIVAAEFILYLQCLLRIHEVNGSKRQTSPIMQNELFFTLMQNQLKAYYSIV
jgi:hypothetical protein